VVPRMDTEGYAAATFAQLRDATAAIDWFRNQGIEPAAIIVAVAPPGERPRPLERGDNQRTDLLWYVALDLAQARLPLPVIRATFRREGGKPSPWTPAFAQTRA
jgi:hypothetical protein